MKSSYFINLWLPTHTDKQDGFVKPETIHLLVASIEALVEKLALNAMAFGDAFDHTDIEVDSCIGNYDGGIFQKTFESTQIIPLDVDEVSEIG